MRQVEVDTHSIVLNAESFVDTDIEDFARRDVTGNEIAVLGIALFKEVVAFVLWNLARSTRILGRAGNPHAAPLAARRFAHQTQLVGAGNRSRMDLDELGVS